VSVEPTGTGAEPLDPAHAARALEHARDREQVFEVLLRAVRSRARFAALLSVHADQIRGRRALADRFFDPTRVQTLRIERNTVAVLETAITSQAPSIGPIATGEPFIDGMLESLGGLADATLVLPVTLGARTVALLVAHRGEDGLQVADVEDVFPLIEASKAALARVLAARAQVATESHRRDTTQSDGYEVEVAIEIDATRRAALARHRKAAAWSELADTLRALVRDGMERGDPDEDEQLELLIELGQIEAEHLQRPDLAIAAWRGAQAIDASNPRILDALEAVFVQQGRWRECLEVLDRRVALAEGKRAKIPALLNLATLAHERLEDDERAAEAYARVLQLDPAHDGASRALEAIHAARAQWEPLVALLLERAARADDPSALEAAARVYEDHTGDARAAFLVWVAVLRRDPARVELVEHLDRLAPRAEAWSELVAECEAVAAELEADHGATAAAVWHLVGRWQRDRLANHDAAVRALEHALRLQPTDVDVLYELLELLRAEGRWMDLVSLLAQRVAAETTPGPRSELYVELGDVYETRLAQPHEAITCYERALVDDPHATAALVALHRCYLDTETWAPLGDLLPRVIDALSPTAPRAVIVDLYVELGTVLATHLGRTADAVHAFREALALDPAHAGALEALGAAGDPEALLDATEASVDAAAREEQLRRYPDVASAWHEHARFDRAIACWQKVLALEPANVGAHQGLVRALRADRQWGPLVVAMHAMLKVLADPHARIALLLDLAAVFEDPLRDVDGATAAYREVIAIAPHHHGALDALARLYDEAGRSRQALELLQRLLDDITEPRPRAELLARVGHVHLAAQDAVNARLAFVQALALDLDSARAREGMARAHLQQGELVAAGEELVRAAHLAKDPRDVIRCLLDAAWLYLHRLDDTARARDCLHEILARDAEHADAKQALAELLAKTQQWQTLWPHLEQEVARVTADPAVPEPERHGVYVRAARCAAELGDWATALKLFELACAIDATPATLLERADALYRSQALPAAAAAYQTILSSHAGLVARPQLVELQRRLAVIYTELGKPAQALPFHRAVLDLDPEHRATLLDLTELHLARGSYDDAIGTLRTLARSAPAGERTTYLERIGDLYRDKLESRPRAMSTYLEGLELEPSNRRLLQRLLDLQAEARQWKPAVETIARFLEHETDPARRGAYCLASAEIRRNELADVAGALDDYEAALDEMFRVPATAATRPRAVDAFRAIVELATIGNDWKRLEHSYRRMIKRLAKDDPLLVPLWDGLGDIYRTRLAHPQSALEAYEVAHALDPEKSAQRSRVLAELYATAGARQPEQVSARAARLVEVDPTNPDAYRAVGRTALDAGRVDEAWCAARALVFLNKASAQEQALFQEYEAQEVRKATGIIDEDAWSLVRHADEDRTLGAIFALIGEAVASLRAGPAKGFDLKAKERIPVEHDTRVVAKIFRHAARVVNVPLPDVYVQPRRPGRLLLANVLERSGRLVPTLIVGRDLMTGYRDTELAAAVGSMLALLQPAYYLRVALPDLQELAAALAAAAHVVGTPNTRPELEPAVAALAPEIQKRLTRATAGALHALLQRLENPVDLTRWRNAVDAAAQRAGLLVSGHLRSTARMLASEPTPPGGLRPNQRVQELVAYSVSPSYFALRKHLGITVA